MNKLKTIGHQVNKMKEWKIPEFKTLAFKKTLSGYLDTAPSEDGTYTQPVS